MRSSWGQQIGAESSFLRTIGGLVDGMGLREQGNGFVHLALLTEDGSSAAHQATRMNI